MRIGSCVFMCYVCLFLYVCEKIQKATLNNCIKKSLRSKSEYIFHWNVTKLVIPEEQGHFTSPDRIPHSNLYICNII